MINAKSEFLATVRDKAVKCVDIDRYSDGTKSILKIGHTEEEYQSFLATLDFEYNAGYGWQEVYGIIWFEDGTWMTRWEYDGSEGWEYHTVPEIHDGLKPVDLNNKDICVMCGIETPYSIGTHIDYRIGYIEGAGQGCFKNCSSLTSRAYHS
jgi:hypothetical protein